MTRSRSNSINSQATDNSHEGSLHSSDAYDSEEESLSSSESSSVQSEPDLPDSDSEDSSVDEETLAGIVINLENLAKEAVSQAECLRLLELIISVESFTMAESWHDFWGNIYYKDGEEQLDGLTPLSFLLLRVNPSFFRLCQQDWESYLEDNTVDTLQAIFFELTENEEVYNDAFEEVVQDSDKKADVIKFLAEACDFIGLANKFGEDALPFGKSEDPNIFYEHYYYITFINFLASNAEFIKRLYLEIPDIVSSFYDEGFQEFDEILKTLIYREQELLVAISNGDTESVKKLILEGVNVSCTRSLSELRTLKDINSASLDKIEKAGILDINGLTLAACLLDKPTRAHIWAILKSEGITHTYNFDKEYALLGLNKSQQDNFERGVNQIMRFLYVNSKDWLRNTLAQKTQLYPIHCRASELDTHYFYNFLFASQFSKLDLDAYDAEKPLQPVDNESFEMVEPLLKLFSLDPDSAIKFDLKNLKSYSLYRNSEGKKMTGVSIPGKQIIVGASSHGHSVLSILMHEICHVVCAITFENHFLPYKDNDNNSKGEFDRIFQYFKQHYQDDMMPKTIKNIFINYAEFGETVQKAELIVRVPELITRHGLAETKFKLTQIPDAMGDILFEFYENNFLVKVSEKFEELKDKEMSKLLDAVNESGSEKVVGAIEDDGEVKEDYFVAQLNSERSAINVSQASCCVIC